MSTGTPEAKRVGADPPVVVHYRHRYLELTETFIAETVCRHERYAPVVVAHERGSAAESVGGETVRLAVARGWSASVPGIRHSAALTLRRWRRALGVEVRTIRPSVIHAHFGPEGIAAAPVARRAGVPLVATFYGVDATYLARHALWRRRFRALFRSAARILAEGPRMRDRLVALGCPESRVALHPIPVRLDRLDFRPSTPPPDGRFVLVQACRLVPKKGVDVTIEAFARLTANWPRAELWVVGDGPERSALERLARERGVLSRVIFHGACSYERYATLLRRGHVFVHPSRTAAVGDSEGGAPTVLLEAQALGLPVVASTHDDIPFVTAGDAALLAPENDPVRVAALVDHLFRSPQEWVSRARAGRDLVESQHHPKALARRLERIYDDALRQGRERP